MGLQYRAMLVGVAFLGIVAAYSLISSYINRSSQPTQPKGTAEMEITFGDDGIPQIKIYYHIFLKNPLRVNPQCLDDQVQKLGENWDITYLLNADDSLDKFLVSPEELKERHQDDLVKAANDCHY